MLVTLYGELSGLIRIQTESGRSGRRDQSRIPNKKRRERPGRESCLWRISCRGLGVFPQQSPCGLHSIGLYIPVQLCKCYDMRWYVEGGFGMVGQVVHPLQISSIHPHIFQIESLLEGSCRRSSYNCCCWKFASWAWRKSCSRWYLWVRGVCHILFLQCLQGHGMRRGSGVMGPELTNSGIAFSMVDNVLVIPGIRSGEARQKGIGGRGTWG